MKETKDGIVLAVKVIPKARKSEVVGWENGVLKVRLKAVPEKGQANDELVAFLADLLNIAKGRITLIRGHTSRQKQLLIAGITLDTLNKALSV